MRTLLLSLFVFLWCFPNLVHAINITSPFGGKVVMIIPCTCQVSGVAVYVLMPVSPYFGMLLWQPPITRIYPRYFPYPGGYVLGRYRSGGECMVGVEPYCYSVPIDGTMTMVGTS